MSHNNSAASVTVGDEGDGIPVSVVVSPHSRRRRAGRKSTAEVVTPMSLPPIPPVAVPSASLVLLDTSTITAAVELSQNTDAQTSRQPAAPPSSPSDPVRTISESGTSPPAPLDLSTTTAIPATQVVLIPPITPPSVPAAIPSTPTPSVTSSDTTIRADAKAETKAEIKSETKAEIKSETKAEIKSETKAETKPVDQVDAKPPSKGMLADIATAIADALLPPPPTPSAPQRAPVPISTPLPSTSSSSAAAVATATTLLTILPAFKDEKKDEKKKEPEKKKEDTVGTIYLQSTTVSPSTNGILHTAFAPYNIRITGPYRGPDRITQWWVGTGITTASTRADLSKLSCVKKLQTENPFMNQGTKPALTSLNKRQFVGSSAPMAVQVGRTPAASAAPAPSGTQRVIVRR